MKITVVGTGYVGVVTAAVFAKFGHQVIGLDIDKQKIKKLSSGKVPFFEPGLQDLVKKGIKDRKLEFTDSYKKGLAGADVIFICVGTPSKKDGSYNLSHVYTAAKEIGKNLSNYAVVVIKSTVPPGTCNEAKEIISRETGVSFDIASVPEFLREGQAVEDALHPSRVVIGVDSKKAQNILLKLHLPIKAPRVVCDLNSAQLIKYASNAFLATKISFINLIARLADKAGADIDAVSQGLGLDPRIGLDFLKAGLGYGGSCFPKDTQALISFAKKYQVDFSFLEEVERINLEQVDYLLEKLKSQTDQLKGRIIALLGLSFKPGTDDIREARSLLLIERLLKLGAKIHAHDPVAVNHVKKLFPEVKYFDDVYDCLKGASALVLVTEWPEYKKLDFTKIKKLMKKSLIVDGRNFFDKNKLEKLGFEYLGVGRA